MQEQYSPALRAAEGFSEIPVADEKPWAMLGLALEAIGATPSGRYSNLRLQRSDGGWRIPQD